MSAGYVVHTRPRAVPERSLVDHMISGRRREPGAAATSAAVELTGEADEPDITIFFGMSCPQSGTLRGKDPASIP